MTRISFAVFVALAVLTTTSNVSAANHGKATYYDASATLPACSLGPYVGYPYTPPVDNVAVPSAIYNRAALCGACVRITGPLGTIVAVVTDECAEGCDDPNHLDLAEESFAKIGNKVDGIIPITYEWVPCNYADKTLKYRFTKDSSAYWFKMQVSDAPLPISRVEIQSPGTGWRSLEKTEDFHWKCDKCGNGPFAVRTTFKDGRHRAETVPFLRDGILRNAAGRQAPFFQHPTSSQGQGGFVSVASVASSQPSNSTEGTGTIEGSSSGSGSTSTASTAEPTVKTRSCRQRNRKANQNSK